MIKLFVNYLLSLCILLYSGANQLSGSAANQDDLQSAIHSEFLVNNSSEIHFNHAIIYQFPFSSDNGNSKIVVAENEIEDDELISLKKLLKNNHFLIICFDGFKLKDSLNINHKFAGNYNPISCLSTSKNVIFQVFRI